MSNRDLLAALQLSKDCDDEEITSTIVSLLISAVHDASPSKSLADIHRIITNHGGTSYLDPLNTIPILLPYDDQTARDIIAIIGECGSAKEVIMAVQEAAERLQRILEADGDEDANESNESKIAPEGTRKHNTSIDQLIMLMDLYASAIPKIKLRQKSAADTLHPILDELQKLLAIITSTSSKNESLNILSSISKLSSNVLRWMTSNTLSEEDSKACKALLRDTLSQSLLLCNRGINTLIAQHALEKYYPRFALRSRTQPVTSAGQTEIMEFLDTYMALDFRFDDFNQQSSFVHLAFYAYRLPEEVNYDRLLSFILPALMSSIQTNTFLDESLAILIQSLHGRNLTKTLTYLPQAVSLPLCNLLPSLASAHPDPVVRHQAFRVLSLLLSTSESQLRFHHLLECTRDSEFPQMRVAAVGLVKDALLQSLSSPSVKDDPFCSPLFLRSFGPILFRPDPPDLFSTTLRMSDFQDTPEPGRLVEILSLYYVLLHRDRKSLTGIRDRDVIKSVEQNLLTPLRSCIERWMSDPAVSDNYLQNITPIVSLKIGLERVDTAIVAIST